MLFRAYKTAGGPVLADPGEFIGGGRLSLCTRFARQDPWSGPHWRKRLKKVSSGKVNVF